jgi:hypothetical protein
LEEDGSIGADVNGDGSLDNALGNLLGSLGSLLGDTDINQQLADAIAEGDLALGMTWPTLEDVEDISNASDVDMHFFSLVDPDDDPSTSDMFWIDPQSFIDGTGHPRIVFSNASIEDGMLEAGPSQFAFSLNLADIPLDLLVDSAKIVGEISTDANGIALANADLSGAVPLGSIIDALNGYLSSDSCACLGLDGELISGSGASFSCTGSFDAGSCSGDAEICGTIANACRLAVPIVSGQADIDLSGDNVNDAISVFIHLSAIGTDISESAE